MAKAFEAATSGAVDDAALELPEISRRSPLAPWKPLLRAIVCYYRHDDAGCERNLAAIAADSAPARLAPVLRSLIQGEAGETLKPAAANLAKHVGGSLAPLREALQAADMAAMDGERKWALQAIREAVSLAQRDCPEIVPSLRQHIALRGWIADLPSGALNAAMGGPARRDARYLLLVARAAEGQADGESPAWPGKNSGAAIKEGWFPAEGPEAGTLYLHMAELAGRVPADVLDSVYDQAREMVQQLMGEEIPMPDTGLPQMHPEWLYEQACGMDPRAEAFAGWLAWAKTTRGEIHAGEGGRGLACGPAGRSAPAAAADAIRRRIARRSRRH